MSTTQTTNLLSENLATVKWKINNRRVFVKIISNEANVTVKMLFLLLQLFWVNTSTWNHPVRQRDAWSWVRACLPGADWGRPALPGEDSSRSRCGTAGRNDSTKCDGGLERSDPSNDISEIKTKTNLKAGQQFN